MWNKSAMSNNYGRTLVEERVEDSRPTQEPKGKKKTKKQTRSPGRWEKSGAVEDLDILWMWFPNVCFSRLTNRKHLGAKHTASGSSPVMRCILAGAPSISYLRFLRFVKFNVNHAVLALLLCTLHPRQCRSHSAK